MQKHHGHRHSVAFSYPVTAGEKLYTIALRPLIFIALLMILLIVLPHTHVDADLSVATLLAAAGATCLRLAVAYVLAVAVAIPLSLFVTSSPRIEALFLPIFDVLESVPILVLFPVLIILFVQFGYLNGAAITILFLTMLWSIVFTVVGGIKIIPRDIMYAAQVFGIKGFALVRKVILPSVVPQFVTGSILAVAAGWNIIIVAEVLHTYIPQGTSAQDLFGIGSVLVAASASGDTREFLAAVVVMVVLIALFNFLVWQRLLHYSQRFRFE